MSTHYIYFYGELETIILELSSNTPPYQVSCGLILKSSRNDGTLATQRAPNEDFEQTVEGVGVGRAC